MSVQLRRIFRENRVLQQFLLDAELLLHSQWQMSVAGERCVVMQIRDW